MRLLKRFEFNWEISLTLLRHWVSKANTMHMYCILTLRLASIKRSHSNSNIPCITASLNTSGIFFVRSWKKNNTGKITIHVHVTWKKIINSIWENSKHKQDMKPKTKCRFSEYSVQKDYLNDKKYYLCTKPSSLEVDII